MGVSTEVYYVMEMSDPRTGGSTHGQVCCTTGCLGPAFSGWMSNGGREWAWCIKGGVSEIPGGKEARGKTPYIDVRRRSNVFGRDPRR